jgi:hypothetical protein
MELPQDANILLSYVNLKLRDFYSSLDAMCEDLDESRAQIEEKLSVMGMIRRKTSSCHACHNAYVHRIE